MASSDPESTTDEKENIIAWTMNVNKNELATLQHEMREEYGIDFEDLAFESKGAADEALKPFYTGLNEQLEIEGEEVEFSIEEGEIDFIIEYWCDNIEVLGELREWMNESYKKEDQDEAAEIIEPYPFHDIKDTDLKRFLNQLEQDFKVEGPTPRPGNGRVRLYPIMLDHLNLEDEELYLLHGDMIVGDGTYEVTDLSEEYDEEIPFELNVNLHIRPVKTEEGLYNLKVDSANNGMAQAYLIDYVRNSLNTGNRENLGDMIK